MMVRLRLSQRNSKMFGSGYKIAGAFLQQDRGFFYVFASNYEIIAWQSICKTPRHSELVSESSVVCDAVRRHVFASIFKENVWQSIFQLAMSFSKVWIATHPQADARKDVLLLHVIAKLYVIERSNLIRYGIQLANCRAPLGDCFGFASKTFAMTTERHVIAKP